jgi:hypothetical protein
MSYKDYYSILGVDRGASAEQIQRAYRISSRRRHATTGVIGLLTRRGILQTEFDY